MVAGGTPYQAAASQWGYGTHANCTKNQERQHTPYRREPYLRPECSCASQASSSSPPTPPLIWSFGCRAGGNTWFRPLHSNAAPRGRRGSTGISSVSSNISAGLSQQQGMTQVCCHVPTATPNRGTGLACQRALCTFFLRRVCPCQPVLIGRMSCSHTRNNIPFHTTTSVLFIIILFIISLSRARR
jgi:hypothetical protein